MAVELKGITGRSAKRKGSSFDLVDCIHCMDIDQDTAKSHNKDVIHNHLSWCGLDRHLAASN
jgi:hypothetical protein